MRRIRLLPDEQVRKPVSNRQKESGDPPSLHRTSVRFMEGDQVLSANVIEVAASDGMAGFSFTPVLDRFAGACPGSRETSLSHR